MNSKYLYLLLFCFNYFSLSSQAQSPARDTSIVKVFRLDSAVSNINESNKQQGNSIQQTLQTVGNKLEKSIGDISQKIDSIPGKISKENEERNKDIIAVIPFYCNVQMYCIIRKNTSNSNYDLILYNNDTLPKVQSKEDSLYLKKYSTEQIVDYTSFRDWLNREYNHGGKSDSRDSCAGKTDYLYSKIQDKISQYENARINSKNKRQVDSLTQLLVDYDRVAGEIRLNKEVPVYALKSIDDDNEEKFPQKKLTRRVSRKSEDLKKQVQSMQQEAENIPRRKEIPVPDYSRRIGTMRIVKARVQIDDNKIFDISFDADIYDNNKRLIRRLNTISNNSYSLSFKGLNNREFLRTIERESYAERELYEGFGFNYGDIINYSPRNSDFTPIVKNGNYELSIDSAVVIYRRRYSDYLSFRTFLDPLGFLGKNPNGFAQLEGDAIIPVNLRNVKRHTWLPEVHANFSYIYNNSINSEVRQAIAQRLANDSFRVFDPSSQQFITKTDSSNYFYNLDIIRNAYYQLYARASIYSIEIKRQNSILHFGIGVHVLGAKVASVSDTATYHKLIPEINLKWVLRPDNIFGADINCAIGYLGNVHRANNSPLAISNASFLWQNAWAIPHELNIYVLTGGKESKGGLFFRYSGWWAYYSKLAKNIDDRLLASTAQIRKSGYFPQVLVGYSTNLSTMVKRSGTDK
jgi:hypothetical protein